MFEALWPAPPLMSCRNFPFHWPQRGKFRALEGFGLMPGNPCNLLQIWLWFHLKQGEKKKKNRAVHLTGFTVSRSTAFIPAQLFTFFPACFWALIFLLGIFRLFYIISVYKCGMHEWETYRDLLSHRCHLHSHLFYYTAGQRRRSSH